MRRCERAVGRWIVLVAAGCVIALPGRAVELVLDGGFDDPAHAAWTFEKYDTSSTIERSTADAAGSPSSGSLRLRKAVGENPNSLRGSQCLEVVPGAEYTVSGKVFWPSASDAADARRIARAPRFSIALWEVRSRGSPCTLRLRAP